MNWSSEKLDAWIMKKENGETCITTIFGNSTLKVVYFYEMLSHGVTDLLGKGLIIEASRLHPDTPHSVKLL
jgi:hypothetical protein